MSRNSASVSCYRLVYRIEHQVELAGHLWVKNLHFPHSKTPPLNRMVHWASLSSYQSSYPSLLVHPTLNTHHSLSQFSQQRVFALFQILLSLKHSNLEAHWLSLHFGLIYSWPSLAETHSNPSLVQHYRQKFQHSVQSQSNLAFSLQHLIYRYTRIASW